MSVTYAGQAAPMMYAAPGVQAFDNASYNPHSAFTGLHDHHSAAYNAHHMQGVTYAAPTTYAAPAATMMYADQMQGVTYAAPQTYAAPVATMSYAAPGGVQMFDNASYNPHSAFTGLHDHHSAAYNAHHMQPVTYSAPTTYAAPAAPTTYAAPGVQMFDNASYNPHSAFTGLHDHHSAAYNAHHMQQSPVTYAAPTYAAPAAPVTYGAPGVQMFDNAGYNPHSAFTGLHDHHSAAYNAHHAAAPTYAAPPATYAAPTDYTQFAAPTAQSMVMQNPYQAEPPASTALPVTAPAKKKVSKKKKKGGCC